MVTHLMVTVADFEIVGPYTLRVVFDDGAEQVINFEPALYGYYYAPLRDVEFFNQVVLDPEIHTLVWPNDADFDPATLYNWHQGDGAELAARMQRHACGGNANVDRPTAQDLLERLERAAQAVDVLFTEDSLIVDLEDGRTLSVPLIYYPRLYHGSPEERENWVIEGEGIHWPELDEDIRTADLLIGLYSAESQESLGQWLERRRVQV